MWIAGETLCCALERGDSSFKSGRGRNRKVLFAAFFAILDEPYLYVSETYCERDGDNHKQRQSDQKGSGQRPRLVGSGSFSIDAFACLGKQLYVIRPRQACEINSYFVLHTSCGSEMIGSKAETQPEPASLQTSQHSDTRYKQP